MINYKNLPVGLFGRSWLSFGIRIIFIWQLVISTLTFVEVYFNGDKSDEDRERLKEFLKKIGGIILMEMEDLIQKIKEIYKSACKERCETCRYRMFAKTISELKMSPEVINELTQEIIEQNEYEKNRWTKIFKPVMAYVGAPVFATYMTNWIHDNFKCVSDFWLGLLITAFVFIVVYIVLGGGIAAIIVCIDTIKINRLSVYCKSTLVN